MSRSEDRPVLTGLVALVAVAAVVGLLFGLAALFGTKMLGLDGGSVDPSAEPSAGSETTMYLPEPEPTETTEPSTSAETQPGEAPSSSESAPAKQITLSAGQLSVSPMQQIDLTGTYPQGEGAILQVQRFEGGSWSDFPVTVSVSNQTFATYVQTSQAGVNKFRVKDTDSDMASNEVEVTVG
ncbi:hypothetical protein [Nocardioides sp. Soil805]|uniref:hypothetical protein n=1 Tax=Nocardioides sp. Soil805 TaxID=1736416 RepID=UPI000703A1BB|nr:hypothetical protein [Nocardioides sp. Soil805]KRF34882.1 hypothetical protein ASG94_12055 [Nocardioides sp. Soil805]